MAPSDRQTLAHSTGTLGALLLCGSGAKPRDCETLQMGVLLSPLTHSLLLSPGSLHLAAPTSRSSFAPLLVSLLGTKGTGDREWILEKLQENSA